MKNTKENETMKITVRTRDQGIITGEWGTDDTWECSSWKEAYKIVDRIDPGRKITRRFKTKIKDPIMENGRFQKFHYYLDIGGVEEAEDKNVSRN